MAGLGPEKETGSLALQRGNGAASPSQAFTTAFSCLSAIFITVLTGASTKGDGLAAMTTVDGRSPSSRRSRKIRASKV